MWKVASGNFQNSYLYLNWPLLSTFIYAQNRGLYLYASGMKQRPMKRTYLYSQIKYEVLIKQLDTSLLLLHSWPFCRKCFGWELPIYFWVDGPVRQYAQMRDERDLAKLPVLFYEKSQAVTQMSAQARLTFWFSLDWLYLLPRCSRDPLGIHGGGWGLDFF